MGWMRMIGRLLRRRWDVEHGTGNVERGMGTGMRKGRDDAGKSRCFTWVSLARTRI